MWQESETAIRLRQLYPRNGPPWFATGHLPYIQAVTATLIARGPAVSVMRLPQRPFDPAAGARAAEIQLAPEAWSGQFPASSVPFTLRWSETHGWNYTIGTDANNGLAFDQDNVLRSRGLGPHVWLVADPHQVVDAVQQLLAGAQLPPVGWAGRDADLQDVALESALAAYRPHPGAVALQGRHEQFVTSRDVLLDLDPDMLDGIAQHHRDTATAQLDLPTAQAQVSASRYEVSALPDGSVSPREAAPYTVFVEPADAARSQWVVLAGQRTVPIYLTADGQESSQRHTYDLDTALTVARSAAAQRREGLFSLTAEQLMAARNDTVIAAPQRPTADQLAVASAWTTPVRQALSQHATHHSPPPTRPPSSGRENPGHETQR